MEFIIGMVPLSLTTMEIVKYNEVIVAFDMSHEVCGLIRLPYGVFNKQSLPQRDSTVFSFMKELALFNTCLALTVF